MEIDYVALIERWINHLGGLGRTPFKITNAIASPMAMAARLGGRGEAVLAIDKGKISQLARLRHGEGNAAWATPQ